MKANAAPPRWFSGSVRFPGQPLERPPRGGFPAELPAESTVPCHTLRKGLTIHSTRCRWLPSGPPSITVHSLVGRLQPMSKKFEDRIIETLSELARSCRSLLNRSKTIADLAGEDPSLGIYSQQSRMFSNYLGKALESLEMTTQPGAIPDKNGPPSLAFDGLNIKDTSSAMMKPLSLPCPEGSITKQSSLKGSSSFLALPDLLGFLSTLNASGTLEVTTLGESFTLVFQGGRLTHAASDDAPEGSRLGDILVSQGALSQTRLSSFLLRNRGSSRKLGEALMMEEQVTEGELFAALEEQIRRLFVRIFGADSATFEFTDGACPQEAIAVKMSVPGLLLESAVSIDHSRRTA